MFEKKLKGYIVIAQNPACSLPNSNKVRQAMANLDWLVHVNIFDNETASFWKGPGMNPKKVKTEVSSAPGFGLHRKGRQPDQQWALGAVEVPGNGPPRGRHFHR